MTPRDKTEHACSVNTEAERILQSVIPAKIQHSFKKSFGKDKKNKKTKQSLVLLSTWYDSRVISSRASERASEGGDSTQSTL